MCHICGKVFGEGEHYQVTSPHISISLGKDWTIQELKDLTKDIEQTANERR